MWTEVPPFAALLLGAVLAGVTRGRVRQAALLLAPVLGALHLAGLPDGARVEWHLFGYSLVPVDVDRMSLLFGYLFHLAALIGNIFALDLGPEEHSTTQHTSAMLYAASAVGAVFAGDLITLFVFWELLALTSVFLIWVRGGDRAIRAGIRYLLVHVLSGVLLLAGALMRAGEPHGIGFGTIGLDGSAGAWLIFLAFGIKAAFPLLHTWLTDAYPEGTPTGTVFLSAFTTKVAVYALARGFAGTELLVYVGAAMTCFPIFYAVVENDLRRVLGYSMINQIGFMITGIGIGTALAVNGAVAHAFNDVIFKGLLFMTMGSVLRMTGRINGSDLGGLYKTMPLTTGFCLVGAASISAFPLFSGFVSKSMVMAATLDAGHVWVWPALLFASAGVFHHAGIKIPYFAFFAHDSRIRTSDPPPNLLAAMFIAAALCLVIGMFPQQTLYRLLPFATSYSPYDVTHVVTQTQLLFFGALAFVALQKTGIYPAELRSVHLDADWLWRRAVPAAISPITASFGRASQAARRVLVNTLAAGLRTAERSQGLLARSWPTGSMVLWVAVLLAAYLLLHLL